MSDTTPPPPQGRPGRRGDARAVTARLYRDAHGIPHLRAADPLALVHAQGRNAATDRAWQLEVERHRAQGTSAAFLGPDHLDWDVFARQARIADTARRCSAALDGPTAAWVRAYVAGVNEGLRQNAHRAPEFAATGLAPGRWEEWTPLALWLSHHILFAGFPGKLWRDKVARVLGEHAVHLFATDGLPASGSNGWLVAPERTAAGGALLAGDPHRFIEAPGVYQQIRLSCPDYDVVGLAVPGVPGIAHFGHTGDVAWTITNSMADYQDLFHERLRRTPDGVEALGPDGWRAAEAHTETVEVAGAAPVTVEVVETARGPVIAAGADGAGAAVSLRYPPRVTGRLGFEALPALLRARTVGDLDRALDSWTEPVNVVLAADTGGGLLHRVAGAVPARDPRNLVRPVPAWEPGHEWRGWQPLPRAEIRGSAVMANERGLAGPLGIEFCAPHRAERIAELLADGADWTTDRMADVHTDTLLASARPLLDLLAGLPGLGPRAAGLRDELLGWDRRMDADSVTAARYAQLRSAVVRRYAATPELAVLAEPDDLPPLFAPWLSATARIGFALEHLLTGEPLPGIDPAALVRAAVEELADAGPTGDTWGDRHRLFAWSALPAEAAEPGPGLSGDQDCVLATSCVPGITDVSARASAARLVWDLADRERSGWIVPHGADGRTGHPHHRDQQPLWLRGALAPVVTDWTRLTEEHHEH